MRHVWSEVIVDGFESDETDFAARLAASPQSVRDLVDSEIMSPLVNGIDGVLLTVTGCADVVDTGEPHRTCLAKEVEASVARSKSATAAILDMIGGDWLNPPLTTWADLPYIGVYDDGLGASALVDPGTTDEARRRNGRVVLGVCRFVAED